MGLKALLGGEAPKFKMPEPPAYLVEYRDDLFGTFRKEVNGPDGKRRIVQGSNLNAQQQAQLNQLERISATSLEQLERLSQMDVFSSNPEYQKQIQRYKGGQFDLLDDNFARAANQQEEILAQRGVTNSSAATEAREARFRAKMKATQQIENQALDLADNLKNREMQQAQSMFTLANQGANQIKSNQFSSLGQGAGIQSGLLSRDLAHQKQVLDIQNQQIQADANAKSAMWKTIGFGVAAVAAGATGNPGMAANFGKQAMSQGSNGGGSYGGQSGMFSSMMA